MKKSLLKLSIRISFFVVFFILTTSCDSKAKITPDPVGPVIPENPAVFKRESLYVDYVEYRNGNLPIIISVPHDGQKTNSAYTLRTKENCPDPNFATVRDTYTTELANLIDSVIHVRTGKYAHLVRCDIKRTYVDMNRERNYAVPRDSKQVPVYDLYHNRMKTARNLVTLLHGKGIVIDIHAHGHDMQQVELGYLLSKATLNKSDSEIMAGNYGNESSIFALSKNNTKNKNFVELLRGTGSFGDMLTQKNVPCVPNSAKPSPDTESYFNGGYITKTHGSAQATGGTVDAIQMEFDSTARSAERRKEYAQNVADAVLQFIALYY